MAGTNPHCGYSDPCPEGTVCDDERAAHEDAIEDGTVCFCGFNADRPIQSPYVKNAASKTLPATDYTGRIK